MANNGLVGRRTRKQWRRLVKAWRSTGQTAAHFAAAKGIVEGTLRWWAWRLECDGDLDAPKRASVTMVPVRIVEVDDPPTPSETSVEEPRPRLAWTLRTGRGELSVYAGGRDGDVRAAIAELLLGTGGSS